MSIGFKKEKYGFLLAIFHDIRDISQVQPGQQVLRIRNFKALFPVMRRT